MSKKAKQYTSQEKAKVAMEAIKGDLTMAQISSQYGVHATQINRLKKEAIEAMVSGFNNKPRSADTSQNELVEKLYQQIGQLNVERDWLKKNLQPLDLAVKKGLIDMNHLFVLKLYRKLLRLMVTRKYSILIRECNLRALILYQCCKYMV